MATTNSVKSDLERPTQQAGTSSVHGVVERMRPEFAKVLPSVLPPERFMRITLTTLRTTPKLMECSQESLLGALMTTAQLGLEPGGPLQHAYLIPYGNEATFVLGYKGMIELAYRSGQLDAIDAKAVRHGDTFVCRHGTNPELTHEINFEGERGTSYVWWAAARMKGGASAFAALGRDDIDRIRQRSKARDSGPWKSDFDAMACKTAIRQLAKFMPMSAELATATVLDETVRTDTSPDAMQEQAHQAATADPFAE